MHPTTPKPIILYDGVCGLCNRLVQFVLKRDSRGRFHFAWLQGLFAAKVLARHGLSPSDLDTVYVVLDYEQPGERLAARSDAVIVILRELGRMWNALALAMRLVPRWFRNWGYNLVARYRYRIFGKYDSCPLPEATHRDRFLDA
jgi:predicted DCC family thiol-disulfide oxidoreductase YuxK